MPAEFESGFFVREPAWHGLGQVVSDAPSSADALRLAGLDWEVSKHPVFVVTGDGAYRRPVYGYAATVRSSDGAVLGIVSDRYEILQNVDAFAFTDELLGTGRVRYETAGSVRGGRRVWLLARIEEEYRVLGDHITPYLLVSNSHDGRSAVQVAMTPVRVVCMNTLNLALAKAQRAWRARHTANMRDRIEEARRTLGLADAYLQALAQEAERLALQKIAPNTLDQYIAKLLPIPPDAGDRQERSIRADREALRHFVLDAPDLENFRGTAWAFVNAVADFEQHRPARRSTATYLQRRFERVVDGGPLLDQAVQLVSAN